MALAAGAILIACAVAAAVAAQVMAGRANPPADPGGAVAASAETGRPANPVDWAYWKGVNPDVVAWIEIPGTSVSLPVVQARADDPAYYLSHDVYGGWNFCGCAYVDAGCPDSIDSRNVVVFGHNITFPPSVFHDLEGYHDQAFAREHRSVLLYTPEEARELDVVGADTIAGWEHVKRVEFRGPADFREYRSERLAECEVRLESSRSHGNLLTLCTCSYFLNPANERTLVYAM